MITNIYVSQYSNYYIVEYTINNISFASIGVHDKETIKQVFGMSENMFNQLLNN